MLIDCYRAEETATAHPALSTKNALETNLLAFVVWSSSGYPYDGWHSYAGEPRKEFDSTWDTLEEANARVRHKFIHENVYELSVTEMKDTVECAEVMDEDTGLLTLSACPEDSEKYTVAAVTRQVFQYLAGPKRLKSKYPEFSKKCL